MHLFWISLDTVSAGFRFHWRVSGGRLQAPPVAFQVRGAWAWALLQRRMRSTFFVAAAEPAFHSLLFTFNRKINPHVSSNPQSCLLICKHTPYPVCLLIAYNKGYRSLVSGASLHINFCFSSFWALAPRSWV